VNFPFLPILKQKNIFQTSFLLLQSVFILILFIAGCSSTKRFAHDNKSETILEANIIRVLIAERKDDLVINVESRIYISNIDKRLARINSGYKITAEKNGDAISFSIDDKDFVSDTFFISSADEDEIIKIDGKKFRGRIKIFNYNSQIKVINQIGLEDYVKGVMTKEMPIGKGDDNYQALKAFSICVRTYALLRIYENKNFYDIYSDTRDQVYGGVDGEHPLSNKAVDETNGQILIYDGKPAIVYYHSTCGGYTENSKNVFTKDELSYLLGVKDGNEAFCKISPRFNWEENYSQEIFVGYLVKTELLKNSNYSIDEIIVKTRFESGRVNELNIMLLDNNGNEETINLFGNSIRSVIKTADGKSILRSTVFEIKLDAEKNIVINGSGSGHGVGMCQWGTIGQSRAGVDYLEILNHYFPGTNIKKRND
jgi:stage II sporulation protein D